MIDESVLARELFNYDPESGLLTWAQNRGKARIGNQVGTLDKDGYIRVRFNKRFHGAHRLCWLHFHGRWPSGLIDHINRIKSDNRLCNLREATPEQNQWNRETKRQGVFWSKSTGKWVVCIRANGTLKHFGSFSCFEEAKIKAKSARKELHGEFANV